MKTHDPARSYLTDGVPDSSLLNEQRQEAEDAAKPPTSGSLIAHLRQVLERAGFATTVVSRGEGLTNIQAETSAYYVAVRLFEKVSPPRRPADCEATEEALPYTEEQVRAEARRLRGEV